MAQKERRRTPRKRLEIPHGLTLNHSGRDIAAQLVDVSDGGVGVEAFVGFDPGETLQLKGALVGSDLGLSLSGRVRVAHSQEVEPGRYRIGLQFVEMAYARVA